MPHLEVSPGPADIVLQGGGIKAISLVGALGALADHGVQPRRLVGASGGAIVAGLIAAGYTAADLRRIIETEPFPALLDTRWYTRLPGIGRPLALLWRLGLHTGRRLEQRLEELLYAKGVRHFGDLRSRGNAEPLQVVVSDVTARRLLVFPRDAVLFGLEPDDLDLSLALRMSASIPVVYEPVRLKHAVDRTEHLLVDGGMLSNFPLWVLDHSDNSAVPKLGLRLVEKRPGESLAERLPVPALARTRLGQLINYVESLARTMMEAHDRRYLDADDVARTIEIPIGDVSTTDFDLSPAGIDSLYGIGQETVRNALNEMNESARSMVG